MPERWTDLGCRVLSLHQPWASLMVWGLKFIETRAWRTNYRGQLLIHAAKANPREYLELYQQPAFQRAIDVMMPKPADVRANLIIARHDALPRGCVLGVVTLARCMPVEFVRVGAAERAFGNYSDGRWAWITNAPALAVRFREPIPAKGKQGLFAVQSFPPEVLEKINHEMEAR